MKKMIANVLVACTLMNGAAFAQEPTPIDPAMVGIDCAASPYFCTTEKVETTRPANRVIGWLGLSTMAAGAAMMIPWADGESWKLNGNDYCYSERTNEINFERKVCGTTKPMIKAGLITVGAGAVMTWLGFRRVAVTPHVDIGVIGASATVKW
jgi:hypothetical protein